MTLGNKIAELRKGQSITQEALAQKLEVTNQAVSKWESDQCCPDIMLLPRLADIFGVTIDELFDRQRPRQEQTVGNLPWPDDNTLRAVAYVGHRLKGHSAPAKGLFIHVNQDVDSVESDFSVCCGNVDGSVDATGNVTCGNVGGNVDAGMDVRCQQISGDVDAGVDVQCAGDIGGSVDAGVDVHCGNIGGDVDAGCDVHCGSIGGDVEAGVSVEIKK